MENIRSQIHDLSNSVTISLMHLELLQRNFLNGNNEKNQKSIETSLSEMKKIVTLLREIKTDLNK